MAFACVRRTTGAVSCWGRSPDGELGNGLSGDGAVTTAPTMPVTGLTDAIQIAANHAGDYACALRATGQVVCWGSNHAGNLGDGTMENRSTPVSVLGLPP